VNFEVLNVRLFLRDPPSLLENTSSHLTTSRVHALLQLLYSYKGRAVVFFVHRHFILNDLNPILLFVTTSAQMYLTHRTHIVTLKLRACLMCVQHFYYLQIVSYHRRATESSQDAIRVFSMILSVRMRGMSILSGMHVYGNIHGCRPTYPRGI